MLTPVELEAVKNATHFCPSCWGNPTVGHCPGGTVAVLRGVRFKAIGMGCPGCGNEFTYFDSDREHEIALEALEEVAEAAGFSNRFDFISEMKRTGAKVLERFGRVPQHAA
jgi:hypothetical protein